MEIVASDELLKKAETTPVVASRLFKQVRSGKKGSSTLWRLLQLPREMIEPHKVEIMAYLESDDVDQKIAVLDSVKQVPWISSEEAITPAKKAFEDSESKVRDTASAIIMKLAKS